MTSPLSPLPPSPSVSPSSRTCNYPYAASPDIIRSNQKDAYQTTQLHVQLTSLLRRLYGSRFTHNFDTKARTFTELLYLGLTTLLGNRTLGEEYCDIHQVEAKTGKLPAVGRRAGYILSAVLLPYGLGRVLPALRAKLRARLERSLAQTPKETTRYHVQAYILENLGAITSTSPVYALTLAVFYFSGSYYHLSKRVFGLRYIFSKQLAPNEQRVGYEVLGVLLVLQMIVQAYLHVQSTVSAYIPSEGSSAMLDNGVEVGLGQQQSSGFKEQSAIVTNLTDSRARIALTTHTPLLPPERAHYDLSDASTLAWLQPEQLRKCTLCLEPMKDPSVTTCGHFFCWTCILDWIHEKPECPLCRQGILGQHVLPLRG